MAYNNHPKLKRRHEISFTPDYYKMTTPIRSTSLLNTKETRSCLPVDSLTWSQMNIKEKQEWMNDNGDDYVYIISNNAH